MNCDINKNKRLAKTFDEFYTMDLSNGTYILDCYNTSIFKDIHPTLTTRQSESNCNFLVEKNIQDMKRYRIRKLTPRECGRLMGVDDNDIDKMVTCGLKDGALYKMYGNSIVVDCMVHMFDNLFLNRPKRKNTGLW